MWLWRGKNLTGFEPGVNCKTKSPHIENTETDSRNRHRNRQRQNPTNNSQMLNRSVFQGFLTPTWWREARIWSELASNKFLSPPPRFRCIKSLQGLRPKWPPSPNWDMLRWHALNPNLVSFVFTKCQPPPLVFIWGSELIWVLCTESCCDGGPRARPRILQRHRWPRKQFNSQIAKFVENLSTNCMFIVKNFHV